MKSYSHGEIVISMDKIATKIAHPRYMVVCVKGSLRLTPDQNKRDFVLRFLSGFESSNSPSVMR
jgi:hypothetical protein